MMPGVSGLRTWNYATWHACMLTCSAASDSLGPVDCSPPGSSVHELFWQEYWSGLPFLPPGDLPNSKIESVSPMVSTLQANSLLLEPPGKPVLGINHHYY